MTLRGNLCFDRNYGIAIVRKEQGASDPWHDDVSKSGARLSWPSAREIREFVDGVDGLAGTCASLTLYSPVAPSEQPRNVNGSGRT